MEKQLKDYLHLYLGCEVESEYGVSILEAISNDGVCRLGQSISININEIKPILRPLSDMSEEEQKELDATKVFVKATPVHQIGNMQWTAESFKWALTFSDL